MEFGKDLLMRVAVTINTAWNIANFRYGLILSMIEAGYDVICFAPRDEFVSVIEQAGARFIPINISQFGLNPFIDGLLILKYYHLLKSEKVDVLLTYTVKPNIYASIAARMHGIKTINNLFTDAAKSITQYDYLGPDWPRVMEVTLFSYIGPPRGDRSEGF